MFEKFQNIPISGPVGTLQMILVKKQIHYSGNRCIGSWLANPISLEA
jgi:hypothetical protein